MSKAPDTWTVSQLIDALKQMPQDLPVLTEGCDCLGFANGVETYRRGDGSEVLLILRDPPSHQEDEEC